ncbi:MAG: hypothetical protein JW720_07770 [Sedimentisphaerales bacterium]|nr:hypothetical protein [Sedimentisphaerales bacterium]
MCKNGKLSTGIVSGIVLAIVAGAAFGNGGPFVLKYPGGDPAAKGVLARIGEDLRPGREGRLRVVKEDLKVAFCPAPKFRQDPDGTPLAEVVAAYTIENPTEEDVEVDFGFPILRGIYIHPLAMMPIPNVSVQLGGKLVKSTVISNSAIYGLIRARAREVIEAGIAADAKLAGAVAAVRDKQNGGREAMMSLLTEKLKWDKRDAALLVEYASLNFENIKSQPGDRMMWWVNDAGLNKVVNENIGALSAIGEQKATQFFARLASCFDAGAGASYEQIFSAWGGDVREKSVDMSTGKVRPREIVAEQIRPASPFDGGAFDPTVYARVDYLDSRANISEEEKASCEAILKNLPVVFTFAPMNILHYRASFPARSQEVLSVSYLQYAYKDTANPASYQLSYVVHPASLWDDFGPINLEVAVPSGVGFRGSDNCRHSGTEIRKIVDAQFEGQCDIYRTALKSKEGELLLGIDAGSWAKVVKPQSPPVALPRISASISGIDVVRKGQ